MTHWKHCCMPCCTVAQLCRRRPNGKCAGLWPACIALSPRGVAVAWRRWHGNRIGELQYWNTADISRQSNSTRIDPSWIRLDNRRQTSCRCSILPLWLVHRCHDDRDYGEVLEAKSRQVSFQLPIETSQLLFLSGREEKSTSEYLFG